MKQMKMMQQMHPCTLQRASKGFQGLKDDAALQIHPCTPARPLQMKMMQQMQPCRGLQGLKPLQMQQVHTYKHGAHTLYTL